MFAGIPSEIYTLFEAYPWRLGTFYCQLKVFAVELSSSSSTLIITAFTLERYFAICHPFRMLRYNWERAMVIIPLIWLTSLILTIPIGVNADCFYAVGLNESFTTSNCSNLTSVADCTSSQLQWRVRPLTSSFVCNIPPSNFRYTGVYMQFSAILLFFAPVCVIAALCGCIAVKLVKSQRLARNSAQTAYNNRCIKAPLCFLGKCLT